MLRPTPLALRWLAGVCTLAVAQGTLSAFDTPSRLLSITAWALLAAALLLMALDALLLRQRPSPQVQRELASNVSLGRFSEVWLTVTATGTSALTVQVVDHPPPGLTCDQPPAAVMLQPGSQARVGYRVRPARRGHFTFERCELHLASPLGLWTHRRYQPLPDHVRVFPDFTQLHGARLHQVDAWLGQLGVHQRPRRGQGQAFHQLREFREGDSLRQVDWKTTARLRTPIVREYQEEQDQNVLLWLDGSRRMRSQDGEHSHFDHALNAGLLLAYVALRQGDAVGLHSFATTAREVAPAKGPQHLTRILSTVYDLDTSTAHADFTQAAATLMARQKRRALVILLTSLRDEDDETLLPALQQVRRQHRVLVANLREQTLDELRQHTVNTAERALGYCASVQWLAGRHALNERLRAQGHTVLDVTPAALGLTLLDTYQQWKRAGVL